MTPFTIAGVQMYISATHDNLAAMKHRVDLALLKFPWLDMIMFSELSPYGPLISQHPDSLEKSGSGFSSGLSA